MEHRDDDVEEEEEGGVGLRQNGMGYGSGLARAGDTRNWTTAGQ